VTDGVTFPRGFRAAAVTAGLKASGRPDLALLVGDAGTVAAGAFTTNAVTAAPVSLTRDRLDRTDGAARAVLVNSGQANAATGVRGAADALAATGAAAERCGMAADEVLACSTGVIGEPLHVDRLVEGIPSLVDALSETGGAAFAGAIRTTDTVDKCAVAEASPYRVGGCAKGVGMIAPSLATMLGFLTTDATVRVEDLRSLVRHVVAPRFNDVTVDGCTSTNDTVLVFASGAARAAAVEPGTQEWWSLAGAVDDVAVSLAQQLIADGEGATHVLIVSVDGAIDDADARRVGHAVCESSLVKTAIFGRDPNPGRFVQAVGASGADVDVDELDVWIGEVRLVAGGVISPDYFSGAALEKAARAAMSSPEIAVVVHVGSGPGRARVLGCDLSYEYVRINGEYTS
jgi:glutamate N-acetyltransferase/amino-acid N-acetyltransferase